MKTWYEVVGLVIFCLLIIHLPRCANADDYITFTARSYHYDRSSDHNEDNHGIGYEKSFNDRWSGHVGYYKNSMAKDSFYALASYHPWMLGKWKTGVSFGGATGYNHPVDPAGGVMFMREWKSIGVNILVTPVVSGIQLKWNLK